MSSLFLPKSLSSFFILGVVVLSSIGCSLTQRRSDTSGSSPESQEEASPSTLSSKKLGIILGPGGARTQAHIGFLRALEKANIPMEVIGGVEWGAYVAALFAQKNKSNEVEWQISKLPSDFFSKSLLSSGTQKISALEDFFKKSLDKELLESGKSHFVCPTQNIPQSKRSLVNRGTFSEAMRLCLPMSPLVSSHKGWVAGVLDYKDLVQYFRYKGIEHILFVDVISMYPPQEKSRWSFENKMLWGFVLQTQERSQELFDQVVRIPAQADMDSFKERKRLIQQGESLGRDFVESYKKQRDE